MRYLDTASLSNTIEKVSEALLFNIGITQQEKEAIASFQVARHFVHGADAGVFTPTDMVINTALRESDDGNIRQYEENLSLHPLCAERNRD